jgi:hypothetical protein
MQWDYKKMKEDINTMKYNKSEQTVGIYTESMDYQLEIKGTAIPLQAVTGP